MLSTATFAAALAIAAGAGLPATLYFIDQINGAACLDGSAPAYWVMKGSSPGFYIHMQGGGWCTSLENCASRARTQTGSSKGMRAGSVTDLKGMVEDWGGWYLSNNASINPMMANWTKVLVQYCDGASWAGGSSTTVMHGRTALHFRGKSNVDGLIDALKNKHGMDEASDVVVSGGSAGGLSTYLHADTFRDALSTRTKVVAMPDAGFFMDNEQSQKSGWLQNNVKWVFQQQNASAGVSPACLQAYESESWKCFVAQYAAPFVETPIFALQSMYDAYQTGSELKSTDPTLVDAYGANLTATLVASLGLGESDEIEHGDGTKAMKNGAFLDACWHHSGAWPGLVIDGVAVWDAMQSWYMGTDTKRLWKQKAPSGYPCKECCPLPCGCKSCCAPFT